MSKIEELLARTEGQRTWGTYHMGQYYFRINTNRTKESLGIQGTDQTISPEIQQFLQNQNYAAIFHEYIHYLHEMSTVIGNVCLGLEISAKSIFSNNFDKELKSCEVNDTTDPKQIELLSKIFHSQHIIFGDSTDKFYNRRLITISNYQYDLHEISVPHDVDLQTFNINVPKLKFYVTENEIAVEDCLLFGKFYLYEGLAYELDREIDKAHKGLLAIDDSLVNTEYTVLRSLAKFVFPDVKKVTFLRLASIALQHINCGQTFIHLLERVKTEVSLGITQDESIRRIKQEMSRTLLNKQSEFNDAQDEYKRVFLKRTQLYKAFGYITDKTKNLYSQRIENPTFEIDMVFSGNYGLLLNATDMCDFMYIFNDEVPYMRDFLGTTIDLNISQSLKALLTYDHYHKVHLITGTKKVEAKAEIVEGQRKCPFFNCCNLDLRRNNEEVCETKPWRIFEISANSDMRYCWYGTGVGEFKSHTER
jgi:hypothetical protein